MKVLACDIGAGTTDIYLYDSEIRLENCLKFVVPSHSVVCALEVRKATRRRQDIFLHGFTVGGGSLSGAVNDNLAAGLQVFMTDKAAFSLRNNLSEVEAMGVKVVERKPASFQGHEMVVGEPDLVHLSKFLAHYGVDLAEVDVIAVAVQDHGVAPPGVSNRKFRLQMWQDILEENPDPTLLAYEENEIPEAFIRMRSVAELVKIQMPYVDVLLMDTATAAIAGSLEDKFLASEPTLMVVNVGNSHTMAAAVEKGKISALLEHHTHLLNAQRLEDYLVRFNQEEVTDEEIFEANGHGLFYLDSFVPGLPDRTIVATGPNRNMFSGTGLQPHYATPGGDMMMTGPMGLVAAARRKFGLE